MQNKGKLFEKEFAESLGWFNRSHPDFWYMRWPDYKDWIAVSPKLFAPKAPCDYVALYNGTFYAMELKSTRGTRFSFNWIKEHQKEHLLNVSSAGGRGYFIFSTRVRNIRACAIPIEEYMILENELSAKGHRSINSEILISAGQSLIRDGSPWDLSPLFT